MNPAVCGVENIAGAEDPPLPPVANCPVGLKQNLDNFTETGHSHQFRLLPPHYDCPTAPPFAASRQASAAALLLVAGHFSLRSVTNTYFLLQITLRLALRRN